MWALPAKLIHSGKITLKKLNKKIAVLGWNKPAERTKGTGTIGDISAMGNLLATSWLWCDDVMYYDVTHDQVIWEHWHFWQETLDLFFFNAKRQHKFSHWKKKKKGETGKLSMNYEFFSAPVLFSPRDALLFIIKISSDAFQERLQSWIANVHNRSICQLLASRMLFWQLHVTVWFISTICHLCLPEIWCFH